MKEFITRLYADENFPVYLGIAIVVLVVLFIIVYFVGKKDQEKIEKTQKLKTIQEQNAFKETTQVTKVEVPVTPVAQPTVQVQTQPVQQPVVAQTIAQAPVTQNVQQPVQNITNVQQQNVAVKPQVSAPVQQAVQAKPIQQTPVQPVIAKQPTVAAAPVAVQPKVEEKPVQKETEKIELDLIKEEKTNEVISPEDIVKDINSKEITEIKEEKKFKPTPVYSSVYVPKKTVEPLDPDITMAIELPKLKDMAVLKEEEESKLNV